MFVLRYFSASLFECLVVVDDALFNLGLDTRNPVFGVYSQGRIQDMMKGVQICIGGVSFC